MVIGILVLMVTVLTVTLRPGTAGPLPAGLRDARPAMVPRLRVTEQQRRAALARASVWLSSDDRSPTLAPPDPTGTFAGPVLPCLYLPEPPHGTTPKFDCLLQSGAVVKVKYGSTPERHAEVAASRLLARLGFGADHMFLVKTVRCYGCPQRPFETAWATARLHLSDMFFNRLSRERYVDFAWASVERRLPAPRIESDRIEGWAFYELDMPELQPTQRTERDALKLAAMLLAHWDNKSENQELVCLDAEPDPDGCARPLAYIQDLGATFGPNKVNLEAWRQVPVWHEAVGCRVSMHPLPYGGGTFPDSRIGEPGRQLLVSQLADLSRDVAAALFAGARFDAPERWADVFIDKVRQIRDAGPCPPA